MWQKLDQPGIYRDNQGRYKVIATGHNQQGVRRQRTSTLSDASLAQAMARRLELISEIEQEGREEPEKRTLSQTSITHFTWQWVVRMKNEGRWGHRTTGSNIQNLRDHILPFIGHLDVNDIRREDLREWIEHVEGLTMASGERYGHATLQRWWRVFRHLAKELYLEGHVDRRFVAWTKDQPGPQGDRELRREDETLTHAELIKFVEVARQIVPGRYAEIVTLAFTGMRAGELYGLDWDCLDFVKNSITIKQSYSRGKLGPTKTGMTREPPMLPPVVEAIQAHRVRMMREQNLGFIDGIVFPSRNGKRRTAGILHKPMMKVAEKCGIDVKVGPQVLRSTFVTVLRNQGIDKARIKDIVGHSSDDSHEHYDRPRVEDLHGPASFIEKIKEMG